MEEKRAIMTHHSEYEHVYNENPRGKEEWDRKSVWTNNGWKLLKFDEKYKSTNWKSSRNCS